jgi:hypothetical protein
MREIIKAIKWSIEYWKLVVFDNNSLDHWIQCLKNKEYLES